MKNSVSDHSFYIDSEEEEEDEEAKDNRSIEDGNDSDSSGSEADHGQQQQQQQIQPSSYNTQWPQSYRQSIDLYSSVPSPGIGFLGTPSLTRLGSSFLSSSLTRRHTPETLPFLAKPAVPALAEQQQQRRSSHSLLPPISSRRSSIRKDDKSKISHDHHPMSRHSSFAQAVVNVQKIAH